MGLQVWLPLNKDTRNNGLTNVTVTNNGATLSNNGVFDKCYSFNGSNSYLTFSSPVSLNSDNSICCWLDLTNMSNTQYFVSFTGGGGIRYSGGDNQFLYYMGSAIAQWTYTKVNKFVHVAFIRKSNTLSLYVNGTLIGDKSLTTSANCDGVGKRSDGYYYSGKMNDFRIYDHCITEEDVKRIYNCKIMDVCASSYNGGFFYDNSGLLINKLASTGVTYSGNSMYFNNSSSRIMSNGNPSGLNISGGTLSVWFTPLTKPNTLILYKDSASRMALGFHYSGDEFIVATDNSKQCYPTSNIVTGQINHVIVSYNQSYTPQYCIVNGVTTTATSHTNYWRSGTSPLIIQADGNYISKVTVYRNQLTEDEAKQLYAIGPQVDILPEGYTRLQYIQSTGTQWIDTNHIWQSINRKVECKINITSHTNNSHIFASTSRISGTDYWDLNPWTNGNGSYQTYINRTYYGSIPLQTGKDYLLIYNLSGNTMFTTYNGTSLNQLSVPTIPNAVNSVYIFHVNGASNYNPLKGKLYYFKMFDNSVMVRNFIPAKRKSDNVVGMYDIVTHTFFTNAGTGTFTAGPEI